MSTCSDPFVPHPPLCRSQPVPCPPSTHCLFQQRGRLRWRGGGDGEISPQWRSQRVRLCVPSRPTILRRLPSPLTPWLQPRRRFEGISAIFKPFIRNCQIWRFSAAKLDFTFKRHPWRHFQRPGNPKLKWKMTRLFFESVSV